MERSVRSKSESPRKALPTAIILKRAEEFLAVPRAYFIKISVVQFRTDHLDEKSENGRFVKSAKTVLNGEI